MPRPLRCPSPPKHPEWESDLAELGWEAGGCGDGCGGGNMDCDACTGEGEDIMECCCCTCDWTEARGVVNQPDL